MTPTNTVSAIANLARMGYSGAHAKYIALEWLEYQKDYSLHSLTKSGRIQLPIFESGMDIDVGGKFFMSCHYGSYPHVVTAIGQRARDKTVYVLIGSESDSLQDALRQRAMEAGITVHFLDGGFGMLRRVKKALDENYPVFVEIDVPWGQIRECNTSFPFVGGQLRAKDGVFRMIERLGVPKNFVLSTAGKQSITVTNFGDLDQARCFAIFADAVRHSPQQYERLFQMHMYFVPEKETDTVIIWQGKNDQYLVHANDLKAWASPTRIAPDASQSEVIGRIMGREVGDVVSL